MLTPIRPQPGRNLRSRPAPRPGHRQDPHRRPTLWWKTPEVRAGACPGSGLHAIGVHRRPEQAGVYQPRPPADACCHQRVANKW